MERSPKRFSRTYGLRLERTIFVRSNEARGLSTGLFLAGIFAASVHSSTAGTTGFISGTVVDEKSGAGVANETVSVSSSSASRTVQTDANGNYSVMSLPPDIYTVRAERIGYQTTSVTDVHVTSDQLLVVSLLTARL